MIRLGYNIITEAPIEIDIWKLGQLCCVGGTGSGKTMSILYSLYSILKTAQTEGFRISLYIGDFKSSADFKGITENYSEYSAITSMIDEYYSIFENTPEDTLEIKILIIDEYAGYITWLTQNDKKKSDEIKNKISSVLMMGRSRHTYIWAIQQRISASLFPSASGALDNFQICLGMSRLSVESRKSLFAGEHLEDMDFEANYHPKTGQGLILIDGQELQPIQIPYIKDKEKLKVLLRKLAKECLR